MKRVRQPAIETNAHRTMWSTMPRVPPAMPVWSQAASIDMGNRWRIYGNLWEMGNNTWKYIGTYSLQWGMIWIIWDIL